MPPTSFAFFKAFSCLNHDHCCAACSAGGHLYRPAPGRHDWRSALGQPGVSAVSRINRFCDWRAQYFSVSVSCGVVFRGRIQTLGLVAIYADIFINNCSFYSCASGFCRFALDVRLPAIVVDAVRQSTNGGQPIAHDPIGVILVVGKGN